MCKSLQTATGCDRVSPAQEGGGRASSSAGEELEQALERNRAGSEGELGSGTGAMSHLPATRGLCIIHRP